MVLAQLGGRISGAIRQMSNATVIDKKVLNDCLNEITHALLQADVQFSIVSDLHTNIKRIVDFDALAAGHDKRKIISKAIFNELCRILNPGKKPPFTPKRGKTSVVMFVGLQGSGKTTTCAKYAHFHRSKGWKPALVCADTFRAGAFDQLKQNAVKAKIPFYGSYTESDPVTIAAQGVERFKKENYDLIIVDTSGRHRQEAALFEEMRQLAEATKPDLVVFVMDGSIGQAAFDQAEAFKQSIDVGAVIVTKMDGHAKGGGALSAVAATKSPVLFIGTGEHVHEFQVFDAEPFVKRLLGMGADLSGFMDNIHQAVSSMDQVQKPPELLSENGNFTLRNMYEQFQLMLNMGPIGHAIPGFDQELMMPKGGSGKMKRYMIMMDSMTKKELDSPNGSLMNNESRILRVAKGSGHSIEAVKEMLEAYKRQAKIWSKTLKKGSKKNKMMNVEQMSKVIPDEMLKQIGGKGALESLIKKMGSGKDIMATFNK
ncbi:hypothetical protein ABFX02_13G135300 [Erythranthe guttata]